MEEILLRREQLVYDSTVEMIKHFFLVKDNVKAQNLVEEAIKNWKLDNKLDAISRLKGWLKENDEKGVIDISKF